MSHNRYVGNYRDGAGSVEAGDQRAYRLVPYRDHRPNRDQASHTRRPWLLYSRGMSLAHGHYPELHDLVDRLRPERAEEARRTLLRLVQGDSARTRLRALPVFDGPEDLSERVDEYLFSAPESRSADR